MSFPPISTRIVEFAGADLPPPDDVDGYLKVLQFAQMAWNYAVLPSDSKVVKIIEDGLLRMPPTVRASVHYRLLEWAERKKKMFPDDRRVIADLQLKDEKRSVTVRASFYVYGKDKPA
jgi:hypothetical protein